MFAEESDQGYPSHPRSSRAISQSINGLLNAYQPSTLLQGGAGLGDLLVVNSVGISVGSTVGACVNTFSPHSSNPSNPGRVEHRSRGQFTAGKNEQGTSSPSE